MHLTQTEIATLRLVLKRIHFFEHLKLNELDELIAALDKRPFRTGERLIQQGESGETFYILASGEVGVYRERLFRRTKIATMATEGFFGEMALINNAKRNATVVGEQDGEVYFLPRETFKRVLLANPRIAELIQQTAEYREAQNRALDLGAPGKGVTAS